MAICATCGNDYDKCFEIRMNNRTFVFDCFECAIQALAPSCIHCECRIIGHGVENNGEIFCCAHCATASGAGVGGDAGKGTEELCDRVG